MFEFTFAILLLLLGLVIWAALGHLLWLALAAFSKLVFGETCSQCGTRRLGIECPNCASSQLAKATSEPSIAADLAAARRLIDFSQSRRWISNEQHVALKKLLVRLSGRVHDGPATPASDPIVDSPVQRPANPSPPLVPSVSAPTPTPTVVAPASSPLGAPPTAAHSPSPHPQPHPLDMAYVAPVPATQRAPLPKRVAADLLKSFMEQSNIRWVELISAALIVVCSVGLVISLWSTLSSTSRFFPSLVFMLATIAVHGAGQYTLRRWKLRATSRGILHIGLMLIPLAMLVGILLSHREGLPTFDLVTFAALSIGATTYGLLAVTASKSLFSRRWPIVAANTIVASLTLWPIHALAERGALGENWSVCVLLPLLLVSLWGALELSRSSQRLLGTASGIARRIAGIATQCLFAGLVAFVFWGLQARASGGLHEWWWVAGGVMAAAWASWGWSTSFTSWNKSTDVPDPGASVTTQGGSGASWLIVGAWLTATFFTLFLIATVWQAGYARPTLAALLASIGSWWLAHGWLCNLRVSLLAGATSLLGAMALIIEHSLAPSHVLYAVDWLSLPRIATLSLVGVAAALLPGVLHGNKRTNSVPGNASLAPARRRTASLPSLVRHVRLAGGVVVIAAALLTVVASLLPFGATPYGGNWSALMLITYGGLAVAAGIALTQVNHSSRILRFAVPLGQALLLLGVVRLCQTSPMLDGVLASLRPARSWAVGTACLAVAWSVIAAALRGLGSAEQKANINSLAGFGGVLGLATGLVAWSTPDHLWLASAIGWTLPLTCLGIFISWRVSAWREATLLTLSLWLGSLVYWLGANNQWWIELGLAGSCATIVIVIALSVAVFEWLLSRWNHLASSQATAGDEAGEWVNAESHWASPLLLLGGWLGLALTLLAPALVNIALSLGGEVTERLRGFVTQSLDQRSLLAALAAAATLTVVCGWRRTTDQSTWLFSTAALLPLTLVLAAAAWLSPPFALTAALWVLAAWLLGSDVLQLGGSVWRTHSQAAWRQFVAPKENISTEVHWLVVGRAVAIGLLMVGTLAFVIAALAEALPNGVAANAGSWLANARIVSISIGPLLVVALVRWGRSVWNDEAPAMTSGAAMLAALFGGCVSAIAVVDRWPSGGLHWQTLSIVFLYTTSLIAAVLAWHTVGFTALRNFLGLRHMLQGKVSTRELLARSTKGARWRRAEIAAWRLSLFAMVPVIVLAGEAALAVIAFPINQLSIIDQLGGLAVALTAAVVLGLSWVLAARRGVTRFGLLAFTLGLAAPFAAAAHASWLMADPSRQVVEARGFEPYRGLTVLWLSSLTIGLAVRWSTFRQGRTLSQLGETAWLLLALSVGCLALVSTTQDPNPTWPLAELSGLALIGVLSGVLSQQVWRGHVAAFMAAAGLSGWWIHNVAAAPLLHEVWLVLWGPVWVAGVALVARQLLRGDQLENHALVGQSARARSRFTVEQSVSLLVPIASAALSFVWVADRGAAAIGQNELLNPLLALACAGLALAVGRLWEPLPGKRGLGVYLNVLALGLVLAMCLSAWAELPRLHSWLIWLTSGLGAMAVMAGLLRELVRESSVLGARLKLGLVTSVENFRHALRWMPTLHTIAAMLALFPCIALVLAFEERALRVAATVLPFIGAIAILPIAIERGRGVFRHCGLTLMSISLVLLWWADLPSAWATASSEGSWIFVQRSFVALVVLGCVYPAVAHWLREKEDWVEPLMNVGWVCGTLGLVTGIAMLVGSFTHQWDQVAANVDLGSKWMTLLAWLAIVARLLQFAAWPHATDRRAPEGVRRAAVFGAELGIASLCAACYFHFPNLFTGIFVDWWPIALFGVAMLSAGIGEWLRRWGQPIIADPVQQSSLLLPIIPLAGVWWWQPTSAQLLWNDWGRYGFLLLGAAGLYGLHGWARKSVNLRALSGALGLFAFWSFLHSHPELRFFEHPQFWLLPPSLAALIFVEFNRERLETGVVVATRYIAILVAYLSSTAEVFLKAFEGQLWQPMLLLVLALAGVAAGIALRVQAFLLGGAAFTMIALLGMVWHAQQAIGQVWPWWAFGIATGVCLIILLGYFEKNRPRVIAYLDEFRQWEK